MTGRPQRPPTMKDVAAAAGVGLKTVSRYVNGETNINPVLVKRIHEAIETLGYRRNLAAASIRPGWSSRMLGLIISDLADPFYSGIASVIEQEVAKQDYILILSNSFDLGDSLDKVAKRLYEQRVEGLIIVPPSTPSNLLQNPQKIGVPTVLVDRPVPGSGLNAVVVDNYGGSLAAGRALAEYGYTRPAYLGDSLSIFTMSERYRGFSDAFPNFVTEGGVPGWFHARTKQQGRTGMNQLLDELQPDCVFTANNRATVGALQAFQDQNRWLPIVGFDDFENASLVRGGVSVVAQNIENLGRTATKLILEQVKHKPAELPAQNIVESVDLVLRGSEKPNW